MNRRSTNKTRKINRKEDKPVFNGMGSKRFQKLKASARADKRDRIMNGRFQYALRTYTPTHPVTHFKMWKEGIDRSDRFNPGLYHKISETSMQKYGIDRLNKKVSTAKKRKQGSGWNEKYVYWNILN